MAKSPADEQVVNQNVAEQADAGSEASPSQEPSSAEGSAPAEGIDVQQQQEQAEELIEAKPDETAATARTQFSLPEAWTDDEVLAWVASVAALPVNSAYSEKGVFFNDPTRARRFSDLSSWSVDELEFALKGQLNDINENKLSAIIKEMRKRSDTIDPAWSFQQVLAFYRQNITPEKTSTGVWVVDVTRNDKTVASWSTAELEAWARGEIKSTSKASDAKLAVELKNRLQLNTKSNSPTDVIAAYKSSTTASDTTQAVATQAPTTSATATDAVKGLTTMNVDYIDGVLKRYSEAVKPGKPVSPEEGKRATTELENLFQYVIKLEDPQAMVSGLERIKAVFVKEQNGLFSPSNAHRFDHLLRKEGDFQLRHTNFVEAMMIYANPNKEVRKQCDLRMLLTKQPADKIEQLVEYFTTIA